jgi:Ni/Co efflux regulator RcnB
MLPPAFLAPPYYYDEYAPLGLGPPPAGYRWVRYGPDLLLVNIATGRIADVVDGVFY